MSYLFTIEYSDGTHEDRYMYFYDDEAAQDHANWLLDFKDIQRVRFVEA